MIDTNVALQFCLANASPETNTVITTVLPSKSRANEKPVSNDIPATKPAPTFSKALYSPGTLDAKLFLTAMNRSKDRDECIAAIQAYIGYDFTKPYGEQDSFARAKAKLAINPVKPLSTPFSRGSLPSVNGYIKGMPDHKERHIQNLLARERTAVDAMLANQQLASNATSLHDKNLYSGLAMVEEERLAEIRADIKRSL